MKYKYKPQKKLLGSSTYKMEKSQKYKYLSEILHLAPSSIGGVNICANASPVCIDLCLNTSGRGQMTSVQKSRLNKKFYFLADRLKFLNHLDREIKLSYARAKRKGFKYTVRLNGTSDLPYERYKLENGLNLMQNNPQVQFIDYTKITNRLFQKLPKNYSLTYSQAENNLKDVKQVLKTKYNIATVFRKKLPKKWLGRKVINGDLSDLRHLEDGKKIIVGLTAKGKAIKNFNGFVQDV
jgi:hypothetical protein|tara:strand:+ start:841 stop:1554 length:714 start_codon:yes stop_codon:yes gene_type:complete